jgi:hypothetical protein
MRRLLWVPVFSLALLTLFAPATSAFSAELPPGVTEPLPGLPGLPSGTILAESDESYVFYTVGPTPGGDTAFNSISILATQVFREDATGYLDFIYAFHPSGPAGTVTQFTLTGFRGIYADPEYETLIPDLVGGFIPSGPQRPQDVSRSVDGDTITFENWLAPDSEVAPLVIRTTATQFVSSYADVTFFVDDPDIPGSFIPGPHIATNVGTYEPAPAPEPASMLMLVIGAQVILFRCRSC